MNGKSLNTQGSLSDRKAAPSQSVDLHLCTAAGLAKPGKYWTEQLVAHTWHTKKYIKSADSKASSQKLDSRQYIVHEFKHQRLNRYVLHIQYALSTAVRF